MNPNRATLAHDRHAVLPGDSGWQSLRDNRRAAPPRSDAEARAEESRAEPAETQNAAVLAQELEGLRRRLRTQPAIEQAKGILIGLYAIDADTAFAVLVRWSQHSNTKLHVLAAGLVAAAIESSGQPQAGVRRFIEKLPTPKVNPH